MSAPATLVLAWGNPGRRDDGLGPAFAAEVRELSLPGCTVEANYQLQVEDAAELAGCDQVFFVDADRRGREPFRVQPVLPEAHGIGFTSHSVSPGRLLALGRELYAAEPRAWLIGIRGYEFDQFGEGLSSRAQANLAHAVDFARAAIEGGEVGGDPWAARAAVPGPEQATRGGSWPTRNP